MLELYVDDPALKFAVLRTELQLPRSSAPPELLLRPMIAYYSKVATKVLKKLKPKGGYYKTVVSPADDGWTVAARLLIVTEKEWSPPVWLSDFGMSVYNPGDSSKTSLVKTVSRVSRYPVGLLRGEPDSVVEILNAQRKRKLRNLTGCLRETIGDE